MFKNLKRQALSKKIVGENIEEFNFYPVSARERIISLLKSAAMELIIAYLFYHSILAAIILVPLVVVFYGFFIRNIKRKKRDLLIRDFIELLKLTIVGLKAGYSVENSMIINMPQLKELCGTDSGIYRMLEVIKHGVQNNISMESILFRAAAESKLSDISEFSQVFQIAKLNGGNMTSIMTQTVMVLQEKLDTEREIDSYLSNRKYELKIMNIIPFVILFYMTVTSPGYFNSLYKNIFGVMVMSLFLGLYFLAIFLSQKLTTIHDGVL